MLSTEVTIFGATGFVGSYVVHELLKSGYKVKIFTRNADSASHLKPLANIGQLKIYTGSLFSKNDLLAILKDSTIVINCIGTIVGGKKNIFALNFDFPQLLTEAILENKIAIKQLIHFSAILNEKSCDNYTKSKIKGEEILKKQLGKRYKIAIIKPSIIFGEEDNFFNFFAKLSKLSFIMPLIGGGKALMQPVYVLDVANFVLTIIKKEESGDFHLVGDERLSIKELMEFICKCINKKRYFIKIPSILAKFMAYFCEMPIFYLTTKILVGKMQPLLTRDQVTLLSYDNISDHNLLIEHDIIPHKLTDIVSKYLEQYQA